MKIVRGGGQLGKTQNGELVCCWEEKLVSHVGDLCLGKQFLSQIFSPQPLSNTPQRCPSTHPLSSLHFQSYIGRGSYPSYSSLLTFLHPPHMTEALSPVTGDLFASSELPDFDL